MSCVDDGEGRSEPRQDLVQPVVVEAVVDGSERDPGECRSEQQQRNGVGVHADEGGAPGPGPPEQGGGPTGSPQQVAVGRAAVARADADAIGAGVGGHLEEHCRVHRSLPVRG